MATNRSKGTRNADGSGLTIPSRTGSYGEAYTVPVGVGRYTMADEGSYYVAQNATLGTQLTGHVAPAISDNGTKSIIQLYNANTEKAIYLDYIVLTTVVANANATAVGFRAYTDSKGATGLVSGGTAITTIYNTRSDLTATTGAVLYAGDAVTLPATNVKRVLQRVVKPYIGVALDSYSFVFGNGASSATGYALTTAVTHTLTSCAPVVVAAGGNFYFVQVGPSGSGTAMTFEFEMGWYER